MDRESIAADLRRDEGWRESAYQDHLGYWTIGYGFLIDRRKGGALPREVGDFWLAHNVGVLEESLRAALRNWDDYPDGIQRALANMSYQMGVGGLMGFRNMLSLIDERRYQEAADEALNSRWAQQTPNRARRVAKWIRGA